MSASPAHAELVPGGCTASNNYTGTGWVEFYHDSRTNSSVIHGYRWNINGQSGSTKNNVVIELKRDISWGEDDVIYRWKTGSAHNGTGSHTPPSRISVPSSWTMYGRFHFIFDRNNNTDPDCHARTGSF
ncbi:hypothetical protein [Nonomuraea sp. SYSU D8015]|uniref:hypothetical protein n=1 Tax=Nonomuraea sp. SYSU D8015 TaxID=2593644 RepID=UPI0016610288|nr:hypothetical protein [Nonomuraea sp. SYSU D8015]